MFFAHVGDGDPAQQELKLLPHLARGQSDTLKPVLIERKMQRGHALAPIAVDRSHQGLACITSRTCFARSRSLSGSGPNTRNATGNGEYGPNTSWVTRTRASGASPSATACLSRSFSASRVRFVCGRYHNLRERGVGQLRRHGEVEARRALSDVCGNDVGFRLLGQPLLDLRASGTRLLYRRAIRHLHFDQHFRAVGGRKELLLHQAHAQPRDNERADHAPGDQPFTTNHKNKKLAEAVVPRRVVDRFVATLAFLDVRKQLHPQIRREHHRNDPRCD